MKSNFILNLILLEFLFFTIKCLKINTLTDEEKDSKEDIINLKITKDLNQEDKYVEKDDVIISFKTDYKDDENKFDISQSVFETKIKDDLNNTYNAACKLWKPLDDNIRVICNFTGNINKDASYINLNNITFQYDNKYNVTIIQTEQIRVIPLEVHIPFIYSNSQTINIEEDKSTSTYELKFNVSKYNKEFIVIQNGDSEHGQLIIDNCENNEKELICTLKKEDILEILWNNKNTFSVAFLSYDFGYYNLSDAGIITINYNGKNKEDIYINITNVKQIEGGGYITFDTNVSSIDNLVSKKFNLTINGSEEKKEVPCFFKKSKTKNLLLLCSVKNLDNFYLGPSKELIELSDIHYKYNFKIIPITSNFSFTLNKLQIKVYDLYNSYPKVLDFTKENNNLDIILTGKFENNIEYENNIILNSTKGNLGCKNLLNSIKCQVEKNQFNQSGYHDLLYYNQEKDSFAFYEISPFEVIFSANNTIVIKIKKQDDNDIIKIGQDGIIYLDTDYNDTNNAINNTNFENINFNVNFSLDNKNEIYRELTCHFWKPKNEKLKLICKLKDNNFDSKEHYITLNEIKLNLTEKNIAIIINRTDNIKIKQLDYEISFIYSDKQEITIGDEESFKIKFKQLSYDQKPLYLYKNEMRYIKLNVSSTTNGELICTVNKTNLLEILAYSGENFYLGQKFDTGLYLFKSVLDISFVYEINKKKIDLKIDEKNKLLTKNVSKNEFIVYEVNITSNNEINSPITTDYFSITLNETENNTMTCLFKKREYINVLLLLCNATKDGLYSLGTIKKEELNKIHILYDFTLEQSKNDDLYNISDLGTKITSVSLLYIEFNEEKRENATIQFEAEHPERIKSILLDNGTSSSNVELNDTHCQNKIWYKECSFNITLFIEEGLYNISHLNHGGNYTINYEVSAINFKFTNDYNGIIVGISIIAGMIVIIAIAYGVWYYLKKKDEKDMNLDVEKEDIEVKKPINSEEKE